MATKLIWFTILVATLSSNTIDSARGNSSVVLVPGDGGSRLEAKLDKISRIHYFCDVKKDWFDIWLDVRYLVPFLIDCLVDNMRLSYDNVTHTTHNTPGVEIRAFSFGSVDSVDYLDRARLPKTGYFSHIIKELVDYNLYQRDVNMVAAPYDFRKAPNELGQFFTNITKLIEATYEQNNQSRITLICHSMGCLNVVHLLNDKTKAWRQIYIRRLISIAAPWAGSFKAIHAMLYGDKLGVIILNGKTVRKIQRTFPSLAYLFPRSPAYPRDRVLIEASDKNYTLDTIEQFFDDVHMDDAKYMWQDTRQLAESIKAPQVELWCLYSSGVETPSKLEYDGHVMQSDHTVIYGDGDGTVNIESLSYCLKWKDQQSQPIYSHVFDGESHVGMLKATAKYISKKIMNSSDHDYLIVSNQ